jgi:hypothetical protein
LMTRWGWGKNPPTGPAHTPSQKKYTNSGFSQTDRVSLTKDDWPKDGEISKRLRHGHPETCPKFRHLKRELSFCGACS